MSQQTSPWLEGAYGWNFGEDNWNSGMDQNLLKFSFMFDRNVDSITASLPAAVNGQAHYLTTDNRLYFAVGATYFSTIVPKWFTITVRTTGQTHQFNGTSLVQVDTPIQLDSRLDAVELTVSTLGTAAFVNTTAFAPSSFVTDLANTADPAKGAALVGYKLPGTGAVARNLYNHTQEIVQASDFGLSTVSSDNTLALQKIADYCATFASTGLLPRVIIAAGEYQYVTSPNWAQTGMTLQAAGEVVFKHTGTGIAFNLDGGATGPGVYGVQILGRLRVSGNVNTTTAVFCRAVHHGNISMRPINATTAIEVQWCVATNFDLRCSPVGYPAFIKVPTTGLLITDRAGSFTSACIFTDPIFEGITGYGINIQGGIQNTFIGGTSESNGNGVFIDSDCTQNNFIGTDFEFNTGVDIQCNGTRNRFEMCLSDKEAVFVGQDNLVTAGKYRLIQSQGTQNEFHKVTYNISAGGGFTDTGIRTVKHSVYNLTAALWDVDLSPTPHKSLALHNTGALGAGTIMGPADVITGGSSTDFDLYHYGTGEIDIWGNNIKNFRLSGTGIGFNGTAPFAKPTITGSRGGNAALASLLTALASYGLIVDGTSA